MRAWLYAVPILVLVLASSAFAATPKEHPINPAVSQYVEMIPTASGQRPVAATPRTPPPQARTAVQPTTTTPAATAPVVTPPLTRPAGPKTGAAHPAARKRSSPHHVKPVATPPAPRRTAHSTPAVASPSFVSSAFGSVGSGGAWLVVLLVAAVLAPLAIFGALRRS
jgi:hypothetical protein